MRESKFRAWVTAKVGEQGWMGEIISLKWAMRHLDGAYIHGAGYEPIFYRMYQVELMQWTGLQDRNGKDVYEGDIVKIDVEGDFAHVLIVFLHGGFVCQSLISRKIMTLSTFVGFEDDLPYGEVLGNMYEHPELLK